MSHRIHNPIRCLLHTQVKGNKTINEYMLESGQHITEVVADLGQGITATREIYRNSAKTNDIEKVVDKVFGKLEVFYPAKSGVIKEVEGIRCTLPNITIEKIVKIAK